MAQQVTLGFIGDLNGALAQQMKGHLDLSGFTGQSAEGQHGLLVDGATAPPLVASVLSGVLQSGGLLAVASPTEEHLTLLRSVTGQGPTDKVAMISYKKVADRPGYQCVLVPFGKSKSTVAGDGTPARAAVVPDAPSIAKSLKDAALGTASLGVAPPGLVPPQGSLAGYSYFPSPCPWDPGYPNINGSYDDNTAKQNTQPIANQFLTEFFIYWVNGVPVPYYVAIVRHTGPMSIGNVLANNQNSRGWFNLYFEILPDQISVNGTNMPSGVQLAGHAPQSASNNAQLPVSMQIPMTLNANTQNGTGPVAFNATVDSSLDYPNWGVLDQTSAGNTSWKAYQTQGWNPVQYPPSDANTWWSNVYDNSNWTVLPMADQSFGSVDFEMVTAWTFDDTLFTSSASPTTTAPTLWVDFSGGWHQSPGFLHNHQGCHGAAGGEHFHIWGNDCSWTWSWGIDLGGIVAQQNID